MVDPEGLEDSSTWFQDVSAWAGGLFIQEGNSRIRYSKAAARPGTTSAERAALRELTQKGQSKIGQVVTNWLYNRPERVAKRAARAAGRSKGNATKSNRGVNALGRGMQVGGWALVAYGCEESYEYISNASNKARATVEEVFGWTGAAGGGTLGTSFGLGLAGSSGGPFGAFLGFTGGVIGSIIGGNGGRRAGEVFYDNYITNPPPGYFVTPY